jgi:hypothetical protein
VLEWKRIRASPIAIHPVRAPVMRTISTVRAGVAARVCIRVLHISITAVHTRHPSVLTCERCTVCEAAHAHAFLHGGVEGGAAFGGGAVATRREW